MIHLVHLILSLSRKLRIFKLSYWLVTEAIWEVSDFFPDDPQPSNLMRDLVHGKKEFVASHIDPQIARKIAPCG